MPALNDVFLFPPLGGIGPNDVVLGRNPSGTVPLSGTAAGTSTATGALVGDATLAGSAAGTSTATGALRALATLAGVAAGTSTATGTLVGSAALAGSAAGTSTATGNLTTTGGNDVMSQWWIR